MFEVFLKSDDLFRLQVRDGVKKLGQVFINLYSLIIRFHIKHVENEFIAKQPKHYNQKGYERHVKQRCSLIDGRVYQVTRQNVVGDFLLELPLVVKEELVVHEPVVVQQKHYRSKLQYRYHLFRHGIIHLGRLPRVLPYNNTLTKPLISEDDRRHQKHDWHPNAVEHGQESDVQPICELEMDWPFGGGVDCFVLMHVRLFGGVGVELAACVHTNLLVVLDGLDHNFDEGEETLHEKGHHNLHTNVLVPFGHVVRKRSLKQTKQRLWLMLSHVCVHYQDDQARVEELCQEDHLGDDAHLHAHGVKANPADHTDYHLFQQCVYCDDDEGD